jgi:hypothetical protein
MLVPCATTCPPSGLTMYTAPLKGALFVSCCGTASGFAIGSAPVNTGNRTAKRLPSANRRMLSKLGKDDKDQLRIRLE